MDHVDKVGTGVVKAAVVRVECRRRGVQARDPADFALEPASREPGHLCTQAEAHEVHFRQVDTGLP